MSGTGVSLREVFAAMDATWPAAGYRDVGGWRIREGRGAGKRVSAASRCIPGADPARAAEAMTALGQAPLFMIRPGEEDLDEDLAESGYRLVDPVNIRAAKASGLAARAVADGCVIRAEFALAAMAELWAAGGIGPARLGVMRRVAGPRTWLMARERDRVAAVAFCAVHDRIAMLHALEVDPACRRRGFASALTREAAEWACDEGARVLALLVTAANFPAHALYRRLGMRRVGGYHYRQADCRGATL